MDVSDWLTRLGLPQYQSAFAEHGIDAEVLQQLTGQDLKEIGVSLLGHRRKLLTAMQGLRPGKEPRTPAIPPEVSNAGTAAAGLPERRHLTVLFCDLVGSTAMSARLDPEELREVVRTYHSVVAEVVCAHGGFVAQYSGDGALVYFGFPVAQENDAECAVRAALVLRDAARAVEAKGTHLEVRVGLGTGLVIVGDRSQDSRASHEPQVMGETPNRAARLEALAEPGGIIIDAATRKLVGRMFELTERNPASLKGLDTPVETWTVLGEAKIDSRFEALRSGETPLIGRDEELKLLERRWRESKAGSGRLVMISGEPGLGKSRLVSAFEQRLKSEDQNDLRYFCSPQHRSTALHPITTHLIRAAGFAAGDTPEEKLEKLRKVFPSPEDLPFMADLLSLPVEPKSVMADLAPQQKRAKVFAAFLKRIEALAKKAPLFLLIEDVHWMDPTTQDLLDLIVSNIDRIPVFAVITHRPEFLPPWTGQASVTTLTLNRLTSEDCATLVRMLTGRAELPAEMIDQITERTDGVPLFAEELTKAVMDSAGPLRRVSSGKLQVPASLHASLIARLDHLGSEARETAQAGSVIGRNFSYSLLSGISTLARMDAALQALVGSGLIFVRGAPPDAIYTFKHALVQDTAYSTLLRAQRQKLHAALAPIMAADETVAPEVLAYHFAGAGEYDKAAGYWYTAGQAANEHSAHHEAIRSFQNALQLLSGLPATRERKVRALEITSALCNPLIAAKWLMPETTEMIARAAQLAGELELIPPPVILYHQWLYHFGLSDHIEALRLAAVFAETGGPALQTRAHTCIANSLCMLGESLDASLEHIATALTAYDRKINSLQRFHYTYDPRCVALSTQSLQLALRGYFEQAKAAEQEAFESAREFNHPQTTGLVLAYKLLRGEFQQDYIQQDETIDAIVRHGREHKVSFWIFWADIFRGFAMARGGRASEGLQILENSLQAFGQIKFNFYKPYHLGLKARAYEIVGDLDKALACITEGIAFAEETGERVMLADLIRFSGQLHLARDGPTAEKTAERLFVRSIELARAQASELHQIRAATALARLWQAQGKPSEAREILSPVYNWFSEGLSSPALAAARGVLDGLSVDAGPGAGFQASPNTYRHGPGAVVASTG